MHSKKRLSRRAFLRAGAWTTLGLAIGCTTPGPTSPPTPAPSATEVNVVSPTNTLAPASTPEPTLTPEPTVTPEPTMTLTNMPVPTSTPEPTVAPKPTMTLTNTPLPTSTPEPTATTVPTPTPLVAVPAREGLLWHYPQAGQSVVSVVQHDGVWDGDKIQSHVVLQMLDAAIVQLTGLGDALTAWRVLFDPGETIGIKVNTISQYTTTPEVAYAVAQRLQDAGVLAEQIVIFDRWDGELRSRGYEINDDGPGVRCHGAKAWQEPTTVTGTTQRIHDVMLSCHALINIPALKEHGTSGFTSALKNHYGTISDPGRLHSTDCDPYIADLNAIPVIRDKTRLVIGDLIRICPYNWNQMTKENKVLMSFDPVAHDTVARQILLNRRQADGRPGAYIAGKSHYLDTAVNFGLGADAEHTEVRDRSLT
jgi:hypothetical protein